MLILTAQSTSWTEATIAYKNVSQVSFIDISLLRLHHHRSLLLHHRRRRVKCLRIKRDAFKFTDCDHVRLQLFHVIFDEMILLDIERNRSLVIIYLGM